MASLDYNEYRKLEDKKDRIVLKKTLYERKRKNDEQEILNLNAGISDQNKQKVEFKSKIAEAEKLIK